MSQEKQVNVTEFSRLGAVLPNGNIEEFADIRMQLRARGVQWHERKVGEGVVFWFYATQLPKLPKDPVVGKIPEFLPVDDEDSGHTVSLLDKFLDANSGVDIVCPE